MYPICIDIIMIIKRPGINPQNKKDNLYNNPHIVVKPTYIINISITKAMFSASNLTDRDPKFAPLFSKLRIIKEITDSLSITFERGNKNID